MIGGLMALGGGAWLMALLTGGAVAVIEAPGPGGWVAAISRN